MIAKELAIVACGGAIGASLRFVAGRIGEVFFASLNFPISTFSVNIVGCLFIGFIAGLCTRDPLSLEVRLFITTGILGGFTTFSAFGLETTSLLRSGHLTLALGYAVASVVGGCTAVALGLWLGGFKELSA